MDIEIKLGPEKHGAVGNFHYHYKPPQARIILRPHKCPGCGENMLNEDDYCNALNHEYLEIFTIKTMLDGLSGGFGLTWNKNWFDDRIEYFIGHMAYHEHGDLLYSLDYG